MTSSDPGPGQPGPPVAGYQAGHHALEALFAHLLPVLAGDDHSQIEALWTVAERALLEHFETEERTILADLIAVRPRETRAVLEEHAYLRRRMIQLRATLPGLSLNAAHTFLDELRAHGRHEERVLYRRAEVAARASGERTRF